MTVSLAVLIPTRNRATLAIEAVESLRAQSIPLEIYVSDNSTNETDARILSDYCRSVTYMRPPVPMPIGVHWSWALDEVLRRSAATHVTVHYDRKIAKRDHLTFLADAAARHPDDVITYLADYVTDDLRLWQAAGTGRLYRVPMSRLLDFLSRGEVRLLGQTFPILSNCLVPRVVLERIRVRFGAICNGYGPDVNFGLRFAALAEHSLHLDRVLAVLHAAQPPAIATNEAGLDDAPIPGLSFGNNALYAEYELVRRAAPDRLPPLDAHGYLGDLAGSLPLVRDESARAQIIGLLRSHGWRGTERPKRRVRRAGKRLLELLRMRMRRWSGFRFHTDADAVRYAIENPRASAREPGRELVALQAVAVE